MAGEWDVYIAIAIMALVTFGTRVLGPEIMLRVPPSPWVEGFLAALSTSVITGVVVNAVARAGLREAMVVALAGLIMLAVKNPTLAMLAGMILGALWTALAA